MATQAQQGGGLLRKPAMMTAAAEQAAAAERAVAASAAVAAAQPAVTSPAATAATQPATPPAPPAGRALRRAAAAASADALEQPTRERAAALAERARALADLPLMSGAKLDAHVERAWQRWREIGSPRYHCAPMVDQSELPFRLLTLRHGANAAYTPMMGARLFAGSPLYRAEHFTTCADDRPLFVQFCGNDPVHFVAAADLIKHKCAYHDKNLGCPQRIASRGNYGAYLMDDLRTVQRCVRATAEFLRQEEESGGGDGGEPPGSPGSRPRCALLSVKIRIFPPEKGGIPATIAYAQMLEAAGASLIAVHGRTRAMRDASAHRADWAAIAAVRAAIRVPCLANGDVRSRRDADLLLEATGCEGVMSAEPLLRDPALFSDSRLDRTWEDVARLNGGAGGGASGGEGAEQATEDQEEAKQQQQQQQQEQAQQTCRVAELKASCDAGVLVTPLESLALCREYLELCTSYPVPMRMMRGHVHKLLGDWLAEHVDLRARLSGGGGPCGPLGGVTGLLGVLDELEGRVRASGRDYPVPAPNERRMARERAREQAREEAIAAQAAVDAAMAALEKDEEREEGAVAAAP